MPKSLSQRCWEWIETQPNFQVKDLVVEMEKPQKTIRSIVDELVRKGAVQSRRTPNIAFLYAKTGANQPSFSRARGNSHSDKNSRQKIWSAMKFFGVFTVDQIEGASEVSRSNIHRYISELRKYEYVAKRRNSKAGAKRTYQLVENSGHKYPVIRKTGLWDQNKNVLVKVPKRKETTKCNG